MGLPPRPSQPRRDPFAMDVDAAHTEANSATRTQREKFRKEGRCMGCGQFGHFIKNCPRGQPSRRVSQPTRSEQRGRQPSGSRPSYAQPQTRSGNWRQPPPAYVPRPPPYAANRNAPELSRDQDQPLIDLLPSSEDPTPISNPGAPAEVAQHLRRMNQEERERVWDELQKEDGEDFL
jgi:hypothetical protein